MKYVAMRGSICIVFQVQDMKDAVYSRCKDDAYVRNKHNATEQCIKRGKIFPNSRMNFNHRSHTTENHGSIVQGIYPRYIISYVVANNPNE